MLFLLRSLSTKEDVGKVIGKDGRIANALRILAGAAAAKLKTGVIVGILEE